MSSGPLHDQDLALVGRCVRGDGDAVDTLVSRYGPYMAQVLRGVFRDGGSDRAVDAEDLVGEVLLRLFEDGAGLLKRYRGEGSLKAYLAGIARRVGLDARRRASVRGAGRIPLEALPEPAQPEEAAPAEPLPLKEALAALPERDRRILTLHYLDGRSYREIGALLQAPPGTIASWMLRARERLKTGVVDARRRPRTPHGEGP